MFPKPMLDWTKLCSGNWADVLPVRTPEQIKEIRQANYTAVNERLNREFARKRSHEDSYISTQQEISDEKNGVR